MRLTTLFAFSFLFFSGLNAQEFIEQGGGEFRFSQNANCRSETQAEEIKQRLSKNIKRLQADGAFQKSEFLRLPSMVSFEFPLKQRGDSPFRNFYSISNYVDHDPSISGTQYGETSTDYNCGNRSYDFTNGYNHSGTDYALFPFAWYQYENEMVEVVAAESGMIIGMDDGNKDDNCVCDGMWNAVYVQHFDGSIAWYGHLKKESLTTKAIGSMVEKGEFLGLVASSGCSTGPHLHFEVFDENGNLIDPFAGSCNGLNANSWWSEQPPYEESSVSAILTHHSRPAMGCPVWVEELNLSNEFFGADDVYVAVYFRDIPGGEDFDMRLIRPDGTLWQRWPGINSSYFPTGFYFWRWILPEEAQIGTWTFELDFMGQTYAHNFQVLEGINPDADQDGFDYTVDCDDNDPTVNPDAIEVCDDVDNDCDGEIDEDVKLPFFRDIDEDGFGDPDQIVFDCFRPFGTVNNSDDCDDSNPAINPNTIEVCDLIDNNCDGQIDEGVGDTFFADLDSDGFGDPNAPVVACFQPPMTVVNSDDCDDTDPDIHPFGTEVCDGLDNNCDGEIDDDLLITFYADLDEDGFGDPNALVMDCEMPNGFTANNEDCDDTNPEIFPGAIEVCDGLDNNCDGETDGGVLNTYFADADGDGFGDPAATIAACDLPDGYATNNQDCDDNNPDIFPGATEVCDGLDNNCDGETDEGVLNTYFADADGDGFGDLEATIADCEVPDGYSINSEDCDDTNPEINPAATEIPNNGIDEDCDGLDLLTSSHYAANHFIEIYPNPAKDWISIKGINSMDFVINIYNSNGKLVLSQKGIHSSNLFNMNVTNLNSGAYLIEIVENDNLVLRMEKLVITNR